MPYSCLITFFIISPPKTDAGEKPAGFAPAAMQVPLIKINSGTSL